MRRWVALTGLLGLLAAAAAPGAVTIDAKKHCEVVDWSTKAVPVTLEPGYYYAGVVSGKISYGRNVGAIPSQFMMRADPIAVNAQGVNGGDLSPGAFFNAIDNSDGTGLLFDVRQRTTVYFFVVDTVVSGNSGAVTIGLDRMDSWQSDWDTMRRVATVRVDAVKNCYELSLKRAQKVTLNPGYYHVRLTSGNVQFEQSEAARRRQCASVMFDFNPRQVIERDHFGGEIDADPLANWAAEYKGDYLGIHVTQKTTISIYFLDDSPSNNSGTVTVSIQPFQPPRY